MKELHTTILEKLSNYFPFDQAAELADTILEFGYKDVNDLHGNIWDTISDYVPEAEASRIASEVIQDEIFVLIPSYPHETNIGLVA